jgi:hypothetical protein
MVVTTVNNRTETEEKTTINTIAFVRIKVLYTNIIILRELRYLLVKLVKIIQIIEYLIVKFTKIKSVINIL